MSTATDTPAALRQRIADLERELRLRDERIRELTDEIDKSRKLVHEMRLKSLTSLL